MHNHGLNIGVKVFVRKSCHLIACGISNELAIKNREVVVKLMTPSQIAEAQRLAREWLAQHQK
jgi:hypothetical protein